MKIIKFEKKKMMPLTNKEYELCLNHTVTSAKNKLEDICNNGKKYQSDREYHHYKVKYRGAARIICSSKYSMPKDILVVFHNGLNYHYYFIIKELAKEFA